MKIYIDCNSFNSPLYIVCIRVVDFSHRRGWLLLAAQPKLRYVYIFEHSDVYTTYIIIIIIFPNGRLMSRLVKSFKT